MTSTEYSQNLSYSITLKKTLGQTHLLSMKCQQWDKIFLQDIVTNVAPRIVRGTTSGHNYGPGQVILEESNFCVFITGDLISNAWDTTFIFSTWKKNNLISIWWIFKLSHNFFSKQKACFDFLLSWAPTSILSWKVSSRSKKTGFDFDLPGRLPQYWAHQWKDRCILDPGLF